MLFVHPSVELITEEDPFRKIELAGRTCYKSQDKMTPDSARSFYKRLVHNNHHAMLEHATFCFMLQSSEGAKKYFNDLRLASNFLNSANVDGVYVMNFLNFTDVGGVYIISGNLRALNECPLAGFLLDVLDNFYGHSPSLSYGKGSDGYIYNGSVSARLVTQEEINRAFTLEERKAHTYTTFRFVTDRGVSHELVRHRRASFAQESTRYCNYSKDGELTFVYPTTFDAWDITAQHEFFDLAQKSEDVYLWMTSESNAHKLTPQQARAVLPQTIKTEIVMTADGIEWEHFFNLRSFGLTGTPHPDMKVIADKALALYPLHLRV